MLAESINHNSRTMENQSLDDTRLLLRQLAAQNVIHRQLQQQPAPMQQPHPPAMNRFHRAAAAGGLTSGYEHGHGRPNVMPGMPMPLHMSTTNLLKLQMMASMNTSQTLRGNTAAMQDPLMPIVLARRAPAQMMNVRQQQHPSKIPTPFTEQLQATDLDETKPKSSTKEAPKAPRRNNERWNSSFDELKKYKATHGDCVVPRGHSENPRLASWVAEQRKQYKLMMDGKQSSITNERVAKLDEIGFTWNAQEAAWDKHLADLKRFRVTEGHCTVPLNHPDYPKLGLWVKEQRRHYALIKQGKHSHMTEARAKDLDEIGFCWDTHEAVWGERLRELCNFKAEHGHCSVPMNYPRNPKLASWVHHQRRQYKKMKEGKECHITKDRIRALESIGFTWNPREKLTSEDCSEKTSDQKKRQREEKDDSFDFKPRKRQVK